MRDFAARGICVTGAYRWNRSIRNIYFLKDYGNKLSERRKLKNFGFITERQLFGPQNRDYTPVSHRYEIEVIHIISNAALIDPYINGLLFRRRRVVVFDYRILRGFGICITGTGIIPAVICGSRRVLTKLIHLQVARSFESGAERSSVTERIVRVHISIIVRVRRIAVVPKIVVREIEGIKFMMALVVLIIPMPFIMTVMRMVFIIRKIMPVIMVFVEIVIEPPLLTGVTVNVFSGNIIGLGFVIRNLFRLPHFLTEISALRA